MTYHREVEQKEVPCPRCNGKGEIPGYRHVEMGICFKCRGAKVLLRWVPVKADPKPVAAAAATSVADLPL